MSSLRGSIAEFKERRGEFPKINTSFSVTKERLQGLEKSIIDAEPSFLFLNKSERVDFMLYLLEICLEGNQTITHFPLTKYLGSDKQTA